MGSYNLTCVASKQTIAPGNPCSLVLISRRSAFSPVSLLYKGESLGTIHGAPTSDCYTRSTWEAKSTIITGKYEDYGRFSLDANPMVMEPILQVLERFYQENIVAAADPDKRKQGFDFKKFVDEVTPDLASALKIRRDPGQFPNKTVVEQALSAWEFLMDGIEQGNLFSLYMGRPEPVKCAVFHQSAVEHLIEIAREATDFQSPSRQPWDMFNRAFKDAAEDCESHYSELKAKGSPRNQGIEAIIDFLKKPVSPLFPGYLTELSDERRNEVWYCKDAIKMRIETAIGKMGDGSGEGYPSIVHVNRLINALVTGVISHGQFYSKMQPTLDFQSLISGMQSLNLKFEPSAINAQDYSNEIGEAYARFIEKTSTAVSQAQNIEENNWSEDDAAMMMVRTMSRP